MDQQDQDDRRWVSPRVPYHQYFTREVEGESRIRGRGGLYSHARVRVYHRGEVTAKEPARHHVIARALAGNPETVPVALCATGTQDDPTSIPWSVENMALPPLARVAGKPSE